MKKAAIILALLLHTGCAAIFPGLQVASTALTLGNLGQTIITMTSSGPENMAVGELPPQYAGNRSRMIREAWEQNYLLAKTAHWEGEDAPWQEIVAGTIRKANDDGILFALVA